MSEKQSTPKPPAPAPGSLFAVPERDPRAAQAGHEILMIGPRCCVTLFLVLFGVFLSYETNKWIKEQVGLEWEL